jgi:hypothetical protein
MVCVAAWTLRHSFTLLSSRQQGAKQRAHN